ncbi:MAG TPA: hypothetical protein DDW91_01560, partial [Shewanella frigidimarina]|nr:hypothetical protein [Shewanella frigidimarina]
LETLVASLDGALSNLTASVFTAAAAAGIIDFATAGNGYLLYWHSGVKLFLDATTDPNLYSMAA